jgi:ABC-2 type transport system ATP-binding protein
MPEKTNIQVQKPIVEVKNLVKKYPKVGFLRQKQVTALKGVSFDIQRGEIFGLLGPNGAGKSTLINTLIGLLSYDSGSINIFGLDLKKHDEVIRDQMNIATTYSQLPPILTAEQNLFVFAKLYGVKNAKQKVSEVIELLGAQKIAKKQVGKMSAGQKTKINLCKALINDPKFLLLDEPTASLDPDVAADIRSKLKKIQKTKKLTILFTSHNMIEVEEMCDRIAFLSDGKIFRTGTAENLVKLITHQEVYLYVEPKRKIPTDLPSKYKAERYSERSIVFTIPHTEGEVAAFLQWCHEKPFHYNDIYIGTPSLEDVFLSIAKQKK